MSRRVARRLVTTAGALLLFACGKSESPAPAASSYPPGSVLLVTLDTTRADRLGAYGGPAGATPHLDALATRGTVFERAFAVAPMTLPAHASMMTARYPPATGIHWNGEERLAESLPTLASRFDAAGYATGAFVSAAVLVDAFGLARGFQTYDDEVAGGNAFEAERSGVDTVARALTWLEAQPAARPAFLWVHLFDPHEPYEPPAELAARFPADPYTAEIAAADAALAPLLAHPRFAATRRGIVTVIGDHGESLGEQGERTHGVLIHDAVLRVPWLLAAPGVPVSREAGEVSQVDLAPTLLALAGLPALENVDGETRCAPDGAAVATRARTLYAESRYGEHVYGWAPLRSTRRDGWKLVRGARDALFETRSDPGESRDRSSSDANQLGALARALVEALDVPAPSEGAGAAPVDAALKAQLSSLGYLSGGGGTPAALDVDPRDRIAVHEKFRDLSAALDRDESEDGNRLLREILAEDPENAFARRALESQLRSALAQAGGDADAAVRLRLPLAQLYASTGRREEALAELGAIADSPAKSPSARSARAYARLELGRKEEARGDWRELSRLAPLDPLPRLNLASLALAERQFAVAESEAREALRLAPGSASARNALAIALDQQGRLAEAEREYEAILAADPSYTRAELNLALLRAGRRGPDDLPRAAAALERVLAGSPREPMALWTLGRIAAERGDRARAAGLFERFVAVAPGHPRAAEARRYLAGG